MIVFADSTAPPPGRGGASPSRGGASLDRRAVQLDGAARSGPAVPSTPAGRRGLARLRHVVARLRQALRRLGHAAADLALGSACAGCGEPPGPLCPSCRAALLGPATRAATVPGRPDLPLAGAAAYAGAVRAAIIEHKERGRLPLATPLGDALAVAVTALLATDAPCRAEDSDHPLRGDPDRATGGARGHPVRGDPEPGCATHGDRAVALVPVPSARSAVRRRGHDPLLRSARRAAATLQRSGQQAAVVAGLRHGRRVADQAGLDRREREDNLHGSLVATRTANRATYGWCVVLVDDIVTSGATLRESARALEAAGVRPCGAAVIAVV